MKLAVILSTYNGEQYLREQLDSILAQTVKINTIVIRDDGSSDNTVAILNEYKHKNPSIVLLEDTLGNIGILRSYSLLLRYVAKQEINFFMFSDQDDIWFKDKTALLLSKIESINMEKPLLVFSDVTLVDTHLNIIATSLVKHQKLFPQKYRNLKSMLLYSPAVGCAMMFNRSLLKFLIPLWDNFPNPDKWALLVATSVGEVRYLPKPTIFYRQHSRNIAGALGGIYRKKLSPSNIQFIQKRYQAALMESRVLLNNLPIIVQKNKRILLQFESFFTGSIFLRVINYFRFCHSVPHWKRKIGLFFSLFFKFK